MRKITLAKFTTTRAASFPGPVDVVFYKEEKGGLFRLKYVDSKPKTILESLHRVMCVEKYAPEIIDGQIIGENSDEVRVQKKQYTYVLQKNAERFEFLDLTDTTRS